MVLAVLLATCDLFTYGVLGGADQTETLIQGDPRFERIMSLFSGVWYSRYAGIGRLDGYRIGRWQDFDAVMDGKTALFPALERKTANFPQPWNGDYFVFYDDTVYGEGEDGTGGNGGWSYFITRYVGIVRAVNIFNSDPDRGALIIEYLKGGCPTWDNDIAYGQRPFFGIYYRVLDSDTIQMANAVDLAALYAKQKYYTERGSLREALELNTVENEAEFISWGVVIPQDREPQ